MESEAQVCYTACTILSTLALGRAPECPADALRSHRTARVFVLLGHESKGRESARERTGQQKSSDNRERLPAATKTCRGNAGCIQCMCRSHDHRLDALCFAWCVRPDHPSWERLIHAPERPFTRTMTSRSQGREVVNLSPSSSPRTATICSRRRCRSSSFA